MKSGTSKIRRIEVPDIFQTGWQIKIFGTHQSKVYFCLPKIRYVNKQILRLALPFIIGNLTIPLVSSVDTALMGHYGTSAQLGAVGLGGAIFNFLYWNFAFIRMSSVGLTSQEFGRSNAPAIARLLAHTLILAAGGALLLILFRKGIGNLAFLVTKGDAQIESFAMQYYLIRIWDAPASIMLMALTGWFIGMQDAKTPMYTGIVVNVVNIAASFVFVRYFQMGIKGIALGTVIGQYTGLCFALVALFVRYKNYLRQISLASLKEFGNLNRFFHVNADIFVRTLAVITVLTWYNFVSAEKGTTILGVNVIFLQLVFIFSFFFDGFSNAAEALSGKYFGAQDIQNLKKVVKYLFFWGIGIALAFSTVYLLFWNSIIDAFTIDISIREAASEYIGWIIAIPLVSIFTFVWDGIYLGTTATREQRNITLIAAFCFFSIYFFGGEKWGNHTLLFAQLVFFGMRGILQSIWYKKAVLMKMKSNSKL